MRCAFAFLLLAAALLCSPGARLSAAEVEFKRVWPGWRTAESFERIAEYFGGGEDTGREVVLRTQPSERAGYYFLVRVKSGAEHRGARFQLEVIRPDGPEPNTHVLAATIPARETVYQLGITGGDWPGGAEASPVAWKLTLLDAGGRVLQEHHSFLWAKPRGPTAARTSK